MIISGQWSGISSVGALSPADILPTEGKSYVGIEAALYDQDVVDACLKVFREEGFKFSD